MLPKRFHFSSHKFQLIAFLVVLIGFPLLISQSPQMQTQVEAQTAPFEVYGINYTGDTLAGGWGAKTWYGGGNTVNLTVTSPVYNGTHSISYQATAPADTLELFTDAPMDASKYTYLSFYAQGGQPNLRYQVTLLGPRDANGNHKPIGTALTLDQYGGIPSTTSWFVYNLPLQTMLQGAGTNQIYGIGFMDLNGGGAQQPLYIDEIQFSGTPAQNTTPTTKLGPPTTPLPTSGPQMPYYPDISPWVFIIPALIIFIAIIFE